MPDDDYKPVAARIAEFRALYPQGVLQPADRSKPFEVVTIADRTFIVVVAAAYRTPDDERPGIGMAWEPWPGTTEFTHDSELQNAETSAWGRAIVAVLAADTSNGVASANEIRSRRPDAGSPKEPPGVAARDLAVQAAQATTHGDAQAAFDLGRDQELLNVTITSPDGARQKLGQYLGRRVRELKVPA